MNPNLIALYYKIVTPSYLFRIIDDCCTILFEGPNISSKSLFKPFYTRRIISVEYRHLPIDVDGHVHFTTYKFRTIVMQNNVVVIRSVSYQEID